ncbi:MAG: hypothetical protein A2259_05045 [Candidatus Moranbacteria bacterium RIFOXYA2_FULL_43_15]|nr:MAG: hypothetical protein A2259_05045 [Candidatus Moranbacteria bacterium RIFOXYA2_FULL_43_15]
MERKNEEFIRSFLKFWRNNGFQILENPSIIPIIWTSSLFVGSGLVSSLETNNTKETIEKNLTMCQPCIKHGTSRLSLDEMMDRDGYLTFFEQLNCFSGSSTPLSSFIKNVWEFLQNVAKLDRQHLYVGVSEMQPEVASFWIKAGIEPNNLVFPDPEAYVLDLPGESLQGIYSPIYYDRADLADYPCESDRCGINCSCDRFLQIGDVGLLHFHDQTIYDHGMGLERVISICNGLPRVSEIAEFRKLKTAVRSICSLSEKQENILADHFRSAIVLFSFSVKPGNTGRGYVLRSLLREIFWILRQKKEEHLLRDAELENLFHVIASFHPFVEGHKDVFVAETLLEMKKFNELVEKGKKIVEKMARKGPLTDKDMVFLWETYGISPDLVRSFC